MTDEGTEACADCGFQAIAGGDQNGDRAFEGVEDQGCRGELLVTGTASTLVAPILPEPIDRTSPNPASRVRIKPNGMEPRK
jgi:hypothetical protein